MQTENMQHIFCVQYLLKRTVYFFFSSYIQLLFPTCVFMCLLNRKLNLGEIFLILYKNGQLLLSYIRYCVSIRSHCNRFRETQWEYKPEIACVECLQRSLYKWEKRKAL